MRKLYRSKDERMVAGICGGLAEYTNSDPTIWRIVFFILLLPGGLPGLLPYLAMWVIVPEKPAA